jgi:hypothetical protein
VFFFLHPYCNLIFPKGAGQWQGRLEWVRMNQASAARSSGRPTEADDLQGRRHLHSSWGRVGFVLSSWRVKTEIRQTMSICSFGAANAVSTVEVHETSVWQRSKQHLATAWYHNPRATHIGKTYSKPSPSHHRYRPPLNHQADIITPIAALPPSASP